MNTQNGLRAGARASFLHFDSGCSTISSARTFGTAGSNLVAASLALSLLGFAASAATPTSTVTLGTPLAVDRAAAAVSLSRNSRSLVADLNGDGLPDILSGVGRGADGTSPVLYLDNGATNPFSNVPGVVLLPQQYSSFDPYYLYGQPVVADLDGDGHPDIVVPFVQSYSPNVPCCSTGFRILRNTGSASAPFDATKAVTIPTTDTVGYSTVAIGDINGDGYPDLVTVGNGNPTTLYLTQGAPLTSGNVAVTPLDAGNFYANDAKVLDVNGDGKPDLLIAWPGYTSSPNGVWIYLNNGTSSPFANVTPLKILQGSGVSAFELGDFNQDGKPDLAVITTAGGDQASLTTTQSVLQNTGSKTQPFSGAQALAADPHFIFCLDLHVADLNGDGLPDLQFGCNSPSVSQSPARALGAVYLNNGTSTPFANAVPIDIPLVPEATPDSPNASQTAYAVDVGTFVKGGLPSLMVEAGTAANTPPAWLFPVQWHKTPVAANDAVVCPTAAACALPVLSNDYDVPGRALTPSSLLITSSPQHGTVTVAGGVVTYKGAAGYSGTDTFQYTVRDAQGNLSNVSTVSITVQAAPVAVNNSADIIGGRTVTIHVLNNVTAQGYGTLDPDSIKITQPPTHGKVTVTSGAVVYTADIGFLGNDPFRYTVSDNFGTPSNAALMTVRVKIPASDSIPISLAGVLTVNAIASDGKPALNGGVGAGYAYAASLLPSFLTTNDGMNFQLGAPDVADAASNGAYVQLLPQNKSGSYSALQILATGVNGAQQNQQFCLNYINGNKNPPRSECYSVSLSDWRTPQHFKGESVAVSMPYRETPSGTRQAGPWNLYAYTVPADPTRTLLSITLPSNLNVVVLGLSLVPAALPNVVSSPTNENVYAIAYGPSSDGGIASGYHLAGDLLGQFVVSPSGIPFQLGLPYSPSELYTGANRTAIGFSPVAGSSQLYLLGTGYNGAQPNKPLVLHYSDGTTATVNQGFSDWRTPQSYPGESIAATMAYRYAPDGTKQAGPWYVYAYAIPLDKTKILSFVQLPNANVLTLSSTLVP